MVNGKAGWVISLMAGSNKFCSQNYLSACQDNYIASPNKGIFKSYLHRLCLRMSLNCVNTCEKEEHGPQTDPGDNKLFF